MSIILTILAFVFTIGLLVLIHELGHFLAAKKFNIKVLEFGFGLPPRAWGKKIGETIFSLNWLPFGGFVHLLGEDEVDKDALDDKRSFAAAPINKRIIVVVAGVVMNLLLAWVLYYIVLSSQNFKVEIPLLTDHKFAGVNQQNEEIILVGSVAENSPASIAGLVQGDRIVSFNNEFIKDAEDLIQKIKAAAGQKIQLTVTDIKKSNYRTIELTPRVDPPPNQGALGVSLAGFEIANLTYQESWQKVLSGPIHGYNLATYSIAVLSDNISQAINKKNYGPISQNVAGPIRIAAFTGDIIRIKDPLIPYLDFIAAISLNLAIVNILPFPGLDGGRLFFLLFEAITRKKPHPKFEKYIHTAGLAILLTLVFAISFSDIRKLFF